MPKREGDLEKISIRIFRGDKERLDEEYPALGHNKVIRHIIRRHIKGLDERQNRIQGDLNDDNPG
jgi:hypothetical protein